MKIEQLPSGSYRAKKVYKGKAYRVTFDHKPTEKEVTIALAEKMEDAGVHKGGTFEYYARDYIEKRSHVLAPSSAYTYGTKINAISKQFKEKNLYDITQVDVQKEINDYAETHSPKSVRTLHGFISAVFGSYRPRFVLKTTFPQKKPRDAYLPSEDDIRAILDAAKGTEDSIGFQLGVLSLRRCEVCALQMSDLNGNELHVHASKEYNKGWYIKETPKTDAGNRIVYLPQPLVDEINEKGYFFKYSPNKLLEHLHKYQKELGIPQFTFHDLRHYFASYSSRLIPEADAMALGGWKSDYVFKQVYRESMKEKRKESAQTLIENMFSQSTKKSTKKSTKSAKPRK